MPKTTFAVKKEDLMVVMERTFDAPKELVFKAFTDAKMIPQWWGPSNLTTEVMALDVKVGGKWRFVQHDASGQTFAFNGEYKEIVPNEKLVFTFEFEPFPGHIIVETVTFEDLGDKTKVVDTSKYANIEDLKGMVQSGMESGAVEGMERLAVLVQKPQ